MSRADLARGTGLSRTTVSSLVTELIGTGQVAETDDRGTPHKGGSGRPPVLVAAQRPGGRRGRRRHRPRARPGGGRRPQRRRSWPRSSPWSTSTPTAPRSLDQAAAMVRDALPRGELARHRPAGRRACACRRRWTGGRPGSAPASCRGWQELLPGEELERRLGVPVLRRQRRQPRRARRAAPRASPAASHDLVYVKLASGLGAGIVLGGRLHRGATGIAGEIGHVQVGEDGQVCRCGNRGCLETDGLRRPAARRCCDRRTTRPLTIERVLELDDEGDAGVRRVLTDAGRTDRPGAGRPLQQPQPASVVVVGGSLGASASLVAGIRASIDRYAQPDTAAAVRGRPGRARRPRRDHRRGRAGHRPGLGRRLTMADSGQCGWPVPAM